MLSFYRARSGSVVLRLAMFAVSRATSQWLFEGCMCRGNSASCGLIMYFIYVYCWPVLRCMEQVCGFNFWVLAWQTDDPNIFYFDSFAMSQMECQNLSSRKLQMHFVALPPCWSSFCIDGWLCLMWQLAFELFGKDTLISSVLLCLVVFAWILQEIKSLFLRLGMPPDYGSVLS